MWRSAFPQRLLSLTVAVIRRGPTRQMSSDLSLDMGLELGLERAAAGADAEVAPKATVAATVFGTVWRRLEKQHGRLNMRFPKEILWLNGAPGSGKGTIAKFVQEARHITHVAVSDLLDTPEARLIKASAKLVSDTDVLYALLNELLKSEHAFGIIVDGFPRSKVQVECLKFLHGKMMDLHHEFRQTEFSPSFSRPKFHIVMLYIEEGDSVERQLARGRRVREHNDRVQRTGHGTLMDLRPTDFDVAAAKTRYQIFREEAYDAIKSLRNSFHYHFISATGPVEKVRDLVLKEFEYQSSLELSDGAYARVAAIPNAADVSLRFRQKLVSELERFEETIPHVLSSVANVIVSDFLPIVHQCVSAGRARIRADAPIFRESPRAIEVAACILSERGFATSVVHDVEHVPVEVYPEGKVVCVEKPIVYFELEFPRGRR